MQSACLLLMQILKWRLALKSSQIFDDTDPAPCEVAYPEYTRVLLIAEMLTLHTILRAKVYRCRDREHLQLAKLGGPWHMELHTGGGS